MAPYKGASRSPAKSDDTHSVADDGFSSGRTRLDSRLKVKGGWLFLEVHAALIITL